MVCPRNDGRLWNSRGVTLLELLGSVLVFMIVSTSVLSVYLNSMKLSKEASYVYTAHTLAKKHLELLRAADFQSLGNAQETDTRIDAEGVPDDAAGEYYRTTAVVTPYNGKTDLAQVTVSVKYTVKGAVNPTPLSLTTVLFQG